MQYLKQEPFKDYKGEAKVAGEIIAPKNPERFATNGEVLAFIADQYVPIPQKLQLNVGEIRKLNRAISRLQAGAGDTGFYAIEDEDYLVLKQVVECIVLLMPLWVRSAGEIEDILESATVSLPNEWDVEPVVNG